MSLKVDSMSERRRRRSSSTLTYRRPIAQQFYTKLMEIKMIKTQHEKKWDENDQECQAIKTTKNTSSSSSTHLNVQPFKQRKCFVNLPQRRRWRTRWANHRIADWWASNDEHLCAVLLRRELKRKYLKSMTSFLLKSTHLLRCYTWSDSVVKHLLRSSA